MEAMAGVDVAAMRDTQRRLVHDWMRVPPGGSTLVTNGRVLDTPPGAPALTQVGFRRDRFSPSGDLGYRGIRGRVRMQFHCELADPSSVVRLYC
jgi:hypothetical protein